MIAGIGESDIGSAGIHGGSMLVLTTVGGSVHHSLRAREANMLATAGADEDDVSAQTSVQATEENRGTFGRKLKMRWKGAFE